MKISICRIHNYAQGLVCLFGFDLASDEFV
jgi:hypothetical protein